MLRVAGRAGGSGQGDRQAGTNRARDPHASWPPRARSCASGLSSRSSSSEAASRRAGASGRVACAATAGRNGEITVRVAAATARPGSAWRPASVTRRRGGASAVATRSRQRAPTGIDWCSSCAGVDDAQRCGGLARPIRLAAGRTSAAAAARGRLLPRRRSSGSTWSTTSGTRARQRDRTWSPTRRHGPARARDAGRRRRASREILLPLAREHRRCEIDEPTGDGSWFDLRRRLLDELDGATGGGARRDRRRRHALPGDVLRAAGGRRAGPGAARRPGRRAVHDLRRWGVGPHRQVDDAPYGGGGGMVLRPSRCSRRWSGSASATPRPDRVVLLSPQGARLDHGAARRLAGHDRLILLCGRYEGVDERVRQWARRRGAERRRRGPDRRRAPGPGGGRCGFSLRSGGSGASGAAEQDSFADGLLESPYYTRPAEFRGRRVPEVLLSGDHGAIARWRARKARDATREPSDRTCWTRKGPEAQPARRGTGHGFDRAASTPRG